MALQTPWSKIKLRRDTAAVWLLEDPVLQSGEPGYETDTGVLRMGDGVSAWSLLPGFRPVHLARKTADQNNIGTAYADVTELGLAVEAGIAYGFDFALIVTADAETTGVDVACNGPASPTRIVYDQVYWTGAATRAVVGAAAYDSAIGNTGSNGSSPRLYRVSGVLINGANAGTLIARAKREAVGSGPNVLAGSHGLLWRL